MSDDQYNGEYFAKYLTRGRLTKAFRGEKRSIYRFWVSYLKKRLSSEAAVLEVGCGLGFLGSRLAVCWKYTGLDISQTAVEYAKSDNHLETVMVASAVSLPIRGETMEAVLAFDIIEHLKEPRSFFAEAWRVLKPNGLVILSMPNPESLGARMKKNSTTLVPTMLLDPTHVSLLPRRTWTSLAKQEGFEVVRAGSDCLWDIPYVGWIPMLLQKIVLVPINSAFFRWIGLLPWTLGENTIVVLRKTSMGSGHD